MGSLHTFDKHEKLSHKKTIDAIFQKKGESIFHPPLLFVYLKTPLETSFPCQVLLSVSKRKFKRAVDRNNIKRKISESYRLSKHRIYDVIPKGETYALSILYLSNSKSDSASISKKLNLCIDEFIKRIS